MLSAAIDFLLFFGAPLFIVESAFGLADEVELLLALRHERPVGIVGANGRIDFEPRGKFDEELDVLIVVEVARELLFHFGFVFDGIEQGFVAILHLVEICQIPDESLPPRPARAGFAPRTARRLSRT